MTKRRGKNDNQSSQKVTGECTRCKKQKQLCSEVSDSLLSWQLKPGVLNIEMELQKSAGETKSATVRRKRNGYQEHTVKQQIREQEKRTGTATGRHNGVHSEAKRTGITVVSSCTSSAIMYKGF